MCCCCALLDVCVLSVVGLCCWLFGCELFVGRCVLVLIVVRCLSWSVHCVLFVALRARCVLALLTFGLV